MNSQSRVSVGQAVSKPPAFLCLPMNNSEALANRKSIQLEDLPHRAGGY